MSKQTQKPRMVYQDRGRFYTSRNDGHELIYTAKVHDFSMFNGRLAEAAKIEFLDYCRNFKLPVCFII